MISGALPLGAAEKSKFEYLMYYDTERETIKKRIPANEHKLALGAVTALLATGRL